CELRLASVRPQGLDRCSLGMALDITENLSSCSSGSKESAYFFMPRLPNRCADVGPLVRLLGSQFAQPGACTNFQLEGEWALWDPGARGFRLPYSLHIDNDSGKSLHFPRVLKTLTVSLGGHGRTDGPPKVAGDLGEGVAEDRALRGTTWQPPCPLTLFPGLLGAPGSYQPAETAAKAQLSLTALPGEEELEEDIWTVRRGRHLSPCQTSQGTCRTWRPEQLYGGQRGPEEAGGETRASIHPPLGTDTIRNYISQGAVPKCGTGRGGYHQAGPGPGDASRVNLLELQEQVLRLVGDHNEGHDKFLTTAQSPGDQAALGAPIPQELGCADKQGDPLLPLSEDLRG
ncbi:PREDICTED: uncharacterized protein LOC105601205, partial [Cercocebus atys]|uniref:uncharacterized protein LOC105601205 n=1 Tax=Cercocebus atys TaxID=9531 RepID=UPI0005F4BF55